MNKEHFSYLNHHPEFKKKMFLAEEFIQVNCPHLAQLQDVFSNETDNKEYPPWKELMRLILTSPIDLVHVKGLPGIGKTTNLRELSQLLQFLGYKVKRVHYDEILKSVAPMFGEDTDRYTYEQWFFISYLLVTQAFSLRPLDLASTSQLEATFSAFSHAISNHYDQVSLVKALASSILRTGFEKQITLMEAPCVANVLGKDRGVKAEDIIASRERLFQRNKWPPHSLVVNLVPDLRTIGLSVKVRSIAAEIKETFSKYKDPMEAWRRVEPQLNTLTKMGINPVTSTNFLRDIHRWVETETLAADEKFLRSMYQEDVVRSESWLAEDPVLRSVIMDEVHLPKSLTQFLTRRQIKELRLLTGCYQDNLLRKGYRPKQTFMVVNEFKIHTS